MEAGCRGRRPPRRASAGAGATGGAALREPQAEAAAQAPEKIPEAPGPHGIKTITGRAHDHTTCTEDHITEHGHECTADHGHGARGARPQGGSRPPVRHDHAARARGEDAEAERSRRFDDVAAELEAAGSKTQTRPRRRQRRGAWGPRCGAGRRRAARAGSGDGLRPLFPPRPCPVVRRPR